MSSRRLSSEDVVALWAAEARRSPKGGLRVADVATIRRTGEVSD